MRAVSEFGDAGFENTLCHVISFPSNVYLKSALIYNSVKF